MSPETEKRMWTTRMREAAVDALPPDKLLPDKQPVYVASWIYVFGVLTIGSLIVVLASGVILGLGGRRGGTPRAPDGSSTASICGASSCSSS